MSVRSQRLPGIERPPEGSARGEKWSYSRAASELKEVSRRVEAVKNHLNFLLAKQQQALSPHALLSVHDLHVVGQLAALGEAAQDLGVDLFAGGVGGGEGADVDALDLAGLSLEAEFFEHEGELLGGRFDCLEDAFEQAEGGDAVSVEAAEDLLIVGDVPQLEEQRHGQPVVHLVVVHDRQALEEVGRQRLALHHPLPAAHHRLHQDHAQLVHRGHLPLHAQPHEVGPDADQRLPVLDALPLGEVVPAREVELAVEHEAGLVEPVHDGERVIRPRQQLQVEIDHQPHPESQHLPRLQQLLRGHLLEGELRHFRALLRPAVDFLARGGVEICADGEEVDALEHALVGEEDEEVGEGEAAREPLPRHQRQHSRCDQSAQLAGQHLQHAPHAPRVLAPVRHAQQQRAHAEALLALLEEALALQLRADGLHGRCEGVQREQLRVCFEEQLLRLLQGLRRGLARRLRLAVLLTHRTLVIRFKCHPSQLLLLLQDPLKNA